MKTLFTHNLQFDPVTASDDGVSDDIAAEAAEAEAIQLADPSGEELAVFWGKVVDDVENDPNWFTFTEE